MGNFRNRGGRTRRTHSMYGHWRSRAAGRRTTCARPPSGERGYRGGAARRHSSSKFTHPVCFVACERQAPQSSNSGCRTSSHHTSGADSHVWGGETLLRSGVRICPKRAFTTQRGNLLRSSPGELRDRGTLGLVRSAMRSDLARYRSGAQGRPGGTPRFERRKTERRRPSRCKRPPTGSSQDRTPSAECSSASPRAVCSRG